MTNMYYSRNIEQNIKDLHMTYMYYSRNTKQNIENLHMTYKYYRNKTLNICIWRNIVGLQYILEFLWKGLVVFSIIL